MQVGNGRTVMKIAITSSGPTLDAEMDPRFGRCPYYLIVDTDSMGFEALENPNVSLARGAGIQSAHLLGEKGVRVLLAGDCGPNARDSLTAAGIGVILDCEGTAANVVDRYKAGMLDITTATGATTRSGPVRAPQGQARRATAQSGRALGPLPSPYPEGSRRASEGPGGKTGRTGRGGGKGQGGGKGRGRKSESGRGRGRNRGAGS